MKRLLTLLLLMVAFTGSALAETYLYPSQVRPWTGFTRKAPCGTGAGDSCGTNPPTWHITPDQCGVLFSTGAARNADGTTFSTKGVRYTLPTVAEFTAFGMSSAAGAAGSSGFKNREAQCSITFVNGAPGPSNYIRIGMDSDDIADKITTFAQGAYDINIGDLVIPFTNPGTITFIWNGVSWLIQSGAPSFLENFNLGQTASHGNGRLFLVTADPTWWSTGSNVGKLAYCPNNGLGTASNMNGGFQLTLLPINCAFLDNDTGAAASSWIVLRNVTNGSISAVTAGAAYGAGTAPNGESYAAGTYAVIVVGSAVAFSSGDTISVHNVRMTNGTNVNGTWIGKKLVAGVDAGCAVGQTCIELHEQIDEGNGVGAVVNVAPPSSFIAGDTKSSTTHEAFNYRSLTTANITTARITNPVNGVDFEGTQKNFTVVGVARTVASVGWTDSATNRLVASYFNPVEKKCQKTTAADRTTASATFVKVNVDMDCPFVYTTGIGAKAMSLGDQGRRVRYELTITMSNNTAGAGCEAAVGFDGTTNEPEIGQITNPTGITNFKQTITIAGTKVGLTENNHTISALVRTVGGGTCTVYSANSFNTSFHWQ